MQITMRILLVLALGFPGLFPGYSAVADTRSLSTYTFNYLDPMPQASHKFDYVIGEAENINLETILRDYVPKPFDAIVHSDNLEFKGKFKKNVMPVFLQEMRKLGWVEIKSFRQGAMQYFMKEIKGSNVKLSIVPAERGGPEEENASTFIYFRIVPNKILR
jgi:hypothetical protein